MVHIYIIIYNIYIYIYAVLGVCLEDFTDSTEEWDDTLDSLMKKTASDSKA